MFDGEYDEYEDCGTDDMSEAEPEPMPEPPFTPAPDPTGPCELPLLIMLYGYGEAAAAAAWLMFIYGEWVCRDPSDVRPTAAEAAAASSYNFEVVEFNMLWLAIAPRPPVDEVALEVATTAAAAAAAAADAADIEDGDDTPMPPGVAVEVAGGEAEWAELESLADDSPLVIAVGKGWNFTTIC